MTGQNNNKPAPMSLTMWLTTRFVLSSVVVQRAVEPPANASPKPGQLGRKSGAGTAVPQTSAPLITGLRDAPQDISMPDVTMGATVGQQEKIGLAGSIQKNNGTS